MIALLVSQSAIFIGNEVETTDSSIIQELYNELVGSKKVAYFNSGMTELSVRCPYCGDSKNNLHHTHMYIQTTAPFFFFCQRCETKGFLHRDTLRDFEIENAELTQIISKTSQKAIKNTTKTGSNINVLFSGKRKIALPAYREESRIHQRKLKYLETRFGTELSSKDLARMKVITEYDDLLELNNLKNLEEFYQKNDYYSSLRNFLQKCSIGFQSSDTNYVVFRHTKLPGNGRRYYTESMNRPYDIGSKIFTIRNRVDLLTPELNLHLSEGPMDISSVYLNMYDRLTSTDTIFSAVNGKAYLQVITLLRRMGFLRINLDLYSDQDVKLENYKYIFNYDHFSSIRIHYNEYPGEKDFGVPLNKIKVKTYKLK